MRALLMTMLLIIVVMSIYMSTIGGENGMGKEIKQSGQRINESIERINLYGGSVSP